MIWMSDYFDNHRMGGWEISEFQQHGHMQGRQASIQLIKIIKCPGSLPGFLEASLWLDDFEPEGFINNLNNNKTYIYI